MVILGYPWLSLAIPGYPWLSLVIPSYPWLSLVIPGYLWLSLAILDYSWLSPKKRKAEQQACNMISLGIFFQGSQQGIRGQVPCRASFHQKFPSDLGILSGSSTLGILQEVPSTASSPKGSQAGILFQGSRHGILFRGSVPGILV